MARARVERVTAAGIALLTLSACQGFVPRNDTPVIQPRLAAAPAPGPSSQRQDANGYPLIGAYPKAAAPQVSDAEVEATQKRFSNVARRSSGSTAPRYARSVAEMQALAARQRSAADALPPPDDAAAAAQAAASSRAQ